MAVLDIRQRTGYLFLAVVLGHVLLISTQVTSRTGVPVLESVVFGVLAEVQRVVMSATTGVRQVWSGYIGLRHVKAENDDLRRQLADAQVVLQQQRALADRARGYQELLDLRDRANLQTVAAEIIGAASASDFLTVTIDKGSRAGLKTDMAVIAPAGVVGRIIATSPRSSKVQLLVDRNAAAGAIIERSRAQGVVMGAGDGRLRLEYMSEVFDVAVGDEVVTSGIDMIYPKGFVIGKVDFVEKAGAAYKRVTIKPAIDFSSIEEVLVVLTPPPGRERETAEPSPKGPGGHE
jgi:rod shape-determining protein MreC